jgi:hypothetical protein
LARSCSRSHLGYRRGLGGGFNVRHCEISMWGVGYAGGTEDKKPVHSGGTMLLSS